MIGLLLVSGLAGCKGAAESSVESSDSARTAIAGMIKSQQQIYASKQKFATSIETLMADQAMSESWRAAYQNNSDGYQYRVEVLPQSVIISAESVINPSLKKLVAAAFVAGGKANPQVIVCESAQPGAAAINNPVNSETCGADSVKLPL
ncbi:MAG: hypothetical protein HC805_03810 [Alkalinema sp. RL_2_19]|nr:hypothetical protein [Alkalinema sp. RL_2_19]